MAEPKIIPSFWVPDDPSDEWGTGKFVDCPDCYDIVHDEMDEREYCGRHADEAAGGDR